jgi:hypothetical protein
MNEADHERCFANAARAEKGRAQNEIDGNGS